MPPLRIAIIGASGHYGMVTGALAELNGAAVLCAVAPGSADEDISPLLKTREVVEADVAVYDEYQRLLDDAAPDIVVVNPFFGLNGVICAETLRRGIPTLCEKPLATELSQIAALRALHRDTSTPLSTMLGSRYEASFYTAWRLVRAGVIGEVIAGSAQKSYKFGVRPDFYRRRESFGGIIPWVGIHAIDWFRWVSGRDYVAVTVRQGNLTKPGYPGLEDHATCLFTLDNGGSAVMSFDYLRPDNAPSHGDDRLRLVGTHGYLEIRGPDFFDVWTDDGFYATELQSPPCSLLADFIRTIETPSYRPLLTAEDALRVTEIALLTRQAGDNGENVVL